MPSANAAILAARQVGFAAWYRTKAQGFDPHTHWVAIGDHELPVSAQNQVTQYKHGLNGLASHGDDDGPDGYRNVTWELYKAAHQPEENEEVTTEQAKEMLALLRSINTTLTGMNGRVGYIANDGMKDLDVLRDKVAGKD